MNLWLIITVIHTTWTVVKLKPEKNLGLNGIRTYDLCHTGAVLYRLSYQAIWELVTLWVRNIHAESEECKWIYERSHWFELRWKIWIYGSCIVLVRKPKDCVRSGPSNIIILSFFASLMFAGLHSHSPLLPMTKRMPWLRRRHLKTRIDMDKKYTKIN